MRVVAPSDTISLPAQQARFPYQQEADVPPLRCGKKRTFLDMNNTDEDRELECNEVLDEILVGCYEESNGFIKHVRDFPIAEGPKSKYEVVNVPSKNKNCLFAVLRHAMGSLFPSGMVLRHWYSKMRETLELVPNELIPITKCEQLSVLLNLDIQIFNGQEQLLITYAREKPIATAMIMVMHEHAFWIRERNLKTCTFCGNAFNPKGFTTHMKRCRNKDNFIQWNCCDCGKHFSFLKTPECDSVEKVTLEYLKTVHTCNQRRMSFFQRMIVPKRKDADSRAMCMRPLFVPNDCDFIDPDNAPENVDVHILDEFEVIQPDQHADDMFREPEKRPDVRTPVCWRYVCEEYLYAFDVEAFPDPVKMSVFQPYSVGTYFSERDSENKYKAFFGPDCMDQMAEDMLHWKRTTGIRTILTFNGRGFDFMFLLEALSKLKRQRFSNIVANGTQIMSFRWGKARSFDLFSFFMCSLSKVCAEFQIDASLQKATFPHDFIRSWNEVEYIGPIPDAKYWPERERDKIPKYETRYEYFSEPSIADAIWPTENAFNLHLFGAYYLSKDVLGMVEVYRKFAREVYERLRLNICFYISAPALAYDMFRTTMSGYYIPLPEDEDMQTFFQKAVYGGRVYPRKLGFRSTGFDMYSQLAREKKEGIATWQNCFDEFTIRVNQSEFYSETEKEFMLHDYLADLDVVSLYPTAMLKLYPCGKMHSCTRAELDIYECMARENPDMLISTWNPTTHEHHFYDTETNQPLPFKTVNLEIGFGVFCVDILPRNDILEPVLPRRCEKTDEIVWDLHYITNGVYTSLDLYRAMARGYKILKFHSGCMFESIALLMNDHITRAKGYKEEGDLDPVNKGAIRSFGKLILNSTYGKFLQRPRFDKCSLIPMEHVFDYLMKHAWKDIIPIAVPGMYFVNVSVTDIDERLRRITKPTYLGAFVLSHSRLIMDTIYAAADPCMNCIQNLPYYGDTDSLILPAHTIPRIRSKGLFCENGEKRFGCVSNENGNDARIIRAYFLAPKSYCFEYIDSKGNIKIHSRLKGVPAHAVRFDHFVMLDEQRRNLLAEGLTRGNPDLVKMTFRSFQRSGIRAKVRYIRPQNLVSFGLPPAESTTDEHLLQTLRYLETFDENDNMSESRPQTDLFVPPPSNEVVLPARKRTRFEPLKIALTEITRSISSTIYTKREWNLLENYSLPKNFHEDIFIQLDCADEVPSTLTSGM
jgi:hypothetical protein